MEAVSSCSRCHGHSQLRSLRMVQMNTAESGEGTEKRGAHLAHRCPTHSRWSEERVDSLCESLHPPHHLPTSSLSVMTYPASAPVDGIASS